VFGTILTRLWTHLGNKALLNLAGLKLYLWEEHLQVRSVQSRLKRSFSTSLGEGSSSQTTSHNITAAANAESAPIADVSMAQDASTPCGDSVADSIGQPSMCRIVQELIEAIKTDDNKPPEPSSDALSIPIKDIFDFIQLYWVEAYDKLAMQGLCQAISKLLKYLRNSFSDHLELAENPLAFDGI